MANDPEQNSQHADLRESRAAQLSHLILELNPEARASVEAMLGNDPDKIDKWIFGISASGGDASDRPPAA